MSSWDHVEGWYHQLVGEEGHYYHRQVILPNLLHIMKLSECSSPNVLDIACGQGVLSRSLPAEAGYTGVDAAPGLIAQAKKLSRNPRHRFIVADLEKNCLFPNAPFTHAVSILALQNFAQPHHFICQLPKSLKPGAQLLLVCNHPCFRIPRQSSWGIDPDKKLQYRRVDSYLSAMRVPIQMHPGRGAQSTQTESFHYPLSVYFEWLTSSGFLINGLYEWSSDKISHGKQAKMENRARREIPLFLCISAIWPAAGL